MEAIFQKIGREVAMMTSSTQSQFFRKILVNTNPHAEFSAPIIFGLGVRSGRGQKCPPSFVCKIRLTLFYSEKIGDKMQRK